MDRYPRNWDIDTQKGQKNCVPAQFDISVDTSEEEDD